MSIALPLIDLTTASVGTTGKVLFDQVGVSAGGPSANPVYTNNRPHLNVFNDSKCSIMFSFIVEGHSDHLTPGAWRTYDIAPGESGFIWTVEAVMNVAAPISQLASTYYFPYESVDHVGALGNSPIGGGVSTSSIQTLSNEGGARNLLVVDIGDLAINQLWQIFTDHFVIFVDQAGVAHQVLKGQISGNPLQIGQAGDISEILGKLLVDQIATFTANIIANGGMNINTIRDNVNGNVAFDLSASGGAVSTPGQFTVGAGEVLNSPATTINGSAGSINFITPVWGSGLKILIIRYSGYINAGASNFTFPSAMNQCVGLIGGLGSATPKVVAKSGATAVGVFNLSAIGVGAGTINSLGTGGWSQGMIAILDSAWDNISIGALGVAATGNMFFVGS